MLECSAKIELSLIEFGNFPDNSIIAEVSFKNTVSIFAILRCLSEPNSIVTGFKKPSVFILKAQSQPN